MKTNNERGLAEIIDVEWEPVESGIKKHHIFNAIILTVAGLYFFGWFTSSIIIHIMKGG